MRLFLPAGLLLSMVFYSCNKVQKADAAFFLKSGDINLITEPGQGAATHRISDLWIYVNGQFTGAYPAGNLIPIPNKGLPCRISILPGIRNNGIESTRLYWPLYQSIDIDTNAVSGSVIKKPLTFRYHPSAKFIWVEGFSNTVGYSLSKSPGSDTTYKLSTDAESLDGSSIELGLTGTARFGQIESSSAGFVLPGANPNLYLELNYKGDAYFLVGLIDDLGIFRDVITIAPQYSWNKIYIELASAVNNPRVSSKYKVFFRIAKDDQTPSARIFLDNIKLVYR
jgi:hypothetical protein